MKSGEIIGHGGDVYYISPGDDYGRYLCEGVKRALDAGARQSISKNRILGSSRLVGELQATVAKVLQRAVDRARFVTRRPVPCEQA
jgi:hypothetical protein